MNIITGARQFATASGATFTLGAVALGSAAIGAALSVTLDGGATNGETVLVRVEYPSINLNADFEVMEATYNDVGTLVRQRTVISSNGTGSVVFTGDVVIFGVVSHEVIHPNDKRLIDFGNQRGLSGWGGYTTDHNTTTDVAGTTNSLTITPPSDTAQMLYWGSIQLQVEQDGNSGSSFRGRVSFFRKNDSGVWVGKSDTHDVGNFSMAADTDFGARHSVCINGVFNQNHLNDSGDWELKPYIRLVDTNTLISVLDCSVNYMVFNA